MVKLWKNASNQILRLTAGVDTLMSDDAACCCGGTCESGCSPPSSLTVTITNSDCGLDGTYPMTFGTLPAPLSGDGWFSAGFTHAGDTFRWVFVCGFTLRLINETDGIDDATSIAEVETTCSPFEWGPFNLSAGSAGSGCSSFDATITE